MYVGESIPLSSIPLAITPPYNEGFELLIEDDIICVPGGARDPGAGIGTGIECK